MKTKDIFIVAVEEDGEVRDASRMAVRLFHHAELERLKKVVDHTLSVYRRLNVTDEEIDQTNANAFVAAMWGTKQKCQ